MEQQLLVALSVFVQLIVLSIVVTKLIDWFITPIFLKLKWDTWWITYVSLVIGGLVGWATGLNAFPGFLPAWVWLGRILTAIACGGGPTLLYKLTDNGYPARLPQKVR